MILCFILCYLGFIQPTQVLDWLPKISKMINLLVPNVDYIRCADRVFKSGRQPNVDFSWREYVSNLEGFCSPLHVTQLNFVSLTLLGNVKAALCLRFLHLRAIRDSNCMPFFSSRLCSICMSASTLLIIEHSYLLCLSVAECTSVYSTVKYEWPTESFSVVYTQKLDMHENRRLQLQKGSQACML